MGCDGSKVFKITAKWSFTSHRVAGPYHMCVASQRVARPVYSENQWGVPTVRLESSDGPNWAIKTIHRTVGTPVCVRFRAINELEID